MFLKEEMNRLVLEFQSSSLVFDISACYLYRGGNSHKYFSNNDI